MKNKIITYLSIAALSLSSLGFGASSAEAQVCWRSHQNDGNYGIRSCKAEEDHAKKVLLITGGLLIGGAIIYAIVANSDSTSYFTEQESENDAFDNFEPYATFDNDTEEFEAGMRYKLDF